VPEPGASNVIMAVFRSFAFAERTDPDVIRLTANTCKSALPVAIPCNDALFVLVLRFMNFSSGVPRAVGFFSHPKREKSFQRMSRSKPCAGMPWPIRVDRSLCGGINIRPTFQGFSIRTFTYIPSDVRAVRHGRGLLLASKAQSGDSDFRNSRSSPRRPSSPALIPF
jgi:hypothetical protein